MKFIKGLLIGAAAGYAYANNVPKDQRKQQMDRLVGTVKEKTQPVTDAVTSNVQSLTDTATKRAAREIDDAGDAAEDKLEKDEPGPASTATGTKVPASPNGAATTRT